MNFEAMEIFMNNFNIHSLYNKKQKHYQKIKIGNVITNQIYIHKNKKK